MKYYKACEFKNMKEMLETRAITHKDNIAFYQKDDNKVFQSTTYEQLKNDVDALGAALIDMGLKDKKIAVIGKNSYEWAISYLATVCGVGTVVPFDKLLSDDEIKNCVQKVNVDTIIYSKEFSERLNNLAQEISINNYISMGKDDLSISNLIIKGRKFLADGNREYLDSKIDDEAPASLLFTSGTTSDSKVVMLSHKNIISNVKSGQMMVKADKNDTFFSILPLHHTFECTAGLLYPLASGASIGFCDSLLTLQKDMKVIKPTIMFVVPRIIESFYEKIIDGIDKKGKSKAVSKAIKITSIFGKYGVGMKKKIFKDIHEQFGGNLKLIMIGGAPVNSKISKYFRSLGILAIQGYGLTECAPLVTLNSDTVFSDDSTGLVLPGSEVIIANPDENGIGEIAVKGPQVMLGYYNNEEATKAVMKNGYFYTGDLGKFDKKGFLRISGRSKNVIVSSNGKNIFPEEIESLINESEIVKESLVYGKKNPSGCESLAVEIVVIDEIKKRIDEYPEYKEEIREILLNYMKEVNAKISEYKRVTELKIRLEEFEKTSSMKIKRFLLEKRTDF